MSEAIDWRTQGVRIVKSGELDFNTAQTPGMTRAAAINHARAGASKLWAGTVSVAPNAKTGAHHHGHLESIIYVVRGRARMRWGERLEFVAEADPGDFIFVPPYVPHQEINALEGEPLRVRGGAQRPGGGGGEPRHRAGRGGGGGALGRSEPPGGAAVTRLEIISDVVCPWCFLGAANLMRVLTERQAPHGFAIRWRPFQLDPSIPPEGLDRAAYMTAKFGDIGQLAATMHGWRRWAPRSASTFTSPDHAFAEHPRRAPGDPLGRARGPADPGRDGALLALLRTRARTSPIRGCWLRRRPRRHGRRRHRTAARRRRRPGGERTEAAVAERREWGSPACRPSSSAAATRCPAPSRSRPGPASSTRSRTPRLQVKKAARFVRTSAGVGFRDAGA